MSKFSKPLPSQEYLIECFYYDPDTGILVWKKRPIEHFYNHQSFCRWNTMFSGKTAGHKSKDRYGFYLSVRVNISTYKAHRLIWKIVTGTDPCGEIDHINGIKTDNRFINLRDATP